MMTANGHRARDAGRHGPDAAKPGTLLQKVSTTSVANSVVKASVRTRSHGATVRERCVTSRDPQAAGTNLVLQKHCSTPEDGAI